MIKNSKNLPVVATSNGWTPIAFFDFDSDYAREEKFIVWLVDSQGHEWFDIARMERGRIVGEWCAAHHDDRRHGWDGLQPVAFKLVDGPDRNALRHIVRRCAAHLPCTERHLVRPQLKFVTPGKDHAELRAKAPASV